MNRLILILIITGVLGITGTYAWLRYESNKISGGVHTENGITDEEKTIKEAGKVTFKTTGPAPQFTGIEKWLNGDPQTMSELQGKVVLVHFWTTSCIACIRIQPDLNEWYKKYKENGLMIIGVHTPQFAYEKIETNINNAITRYEIPYPIALDTNYKTWNGYKNQFWPADYLIDTTGKIVYTHIGEGGSATTEKAIRLLLSLETDPLSPVSSVSDPSQVKSPTILFSLNHLEFIGNETIPTSTAKRYKLPASLAINTYALEGSWQLNKDTATLTKGGGRIQLRFDAAKVYIKVTAAQAQDLKITVDGKTQLPVPVGATDTYQIFDSGDYKEHLLEIEIPFAPFKITQFLFG